MTKIAFKGGLLIIGTGALEKGKSGDLRVLNKNKWTSNWFTYFFILVLINFFIILFLGRIYTMDNFI